MVGIFFPAHSRKKKKDKDKKKLEEVAMTNHETVTVSRPSKTKAEIAFEKAKREKVGLKLRFLFFVV